jgi:hypothetical protein
MEVELAKMSVNFWCLRPMARIEVADIPVFPATCQARFPIASAKADFTLLTTARPEPAALDANRAFLYTKGPKWSGPPYDQVQLLATGSPLPAGGRPRMDCGHP